MILTARINSLEVVLDDEFPGITHTPEMVEDIVHRLVRQVVEMYDMLPNPEPAPEPETAAPDEGE